MSLRVCVAVAFVVVTFAACGGGEEKPPTPGELKAFGAACDKANEGKRVAVAGYLRFPDKFTGNLSVVLRMYEASDFSGKPVGVQTRMGNQPNQVQAPPGKFTDKDLKVYMTNGQTAGLGTKVKVSGDVYFPTVGQDFQCGLSNPLIEPAN